MYLYIYIYIYIYIYVYIYYIYIYITPILICWDLCTVCFLSPCSFSIFIMFVAVVVSGKFSVLRFIECQENIPAN